MEERRKVSERACERVYVVRVKDVGCFFCRVSID